MPDRGRLRTRAAVLLVLFTVSCGAQPTTGVFLETFDDGPGGWYADRYSPLLVWDGVAYCYSPWWLDSNHAPPGGGYLHLLMWMYTTKQYYQADTPYMRKLPYRGNPFAEQGYSTNLTNAKLSVRLRGEANLKGAEILLLVQARTEKTTANFVLSGQPFRLTREWSEQTVTLTPDPRQWRCIGARHDMNQTYGCDDIEKVLRDINLDIIVVLFPVKPAPACGALKDPHRTRAGQDYPVDPASLPKGVIQFDSVKIEYPH